MRVEIEKMKLYAGGVESAPIWTIMVKNDHEIVLHHLTHVDTDTLLKIRDELNKLDLTRHG